LTATPEALVENQMDTHLWQVSTETDQEEAAEKLGRYDLLSLPVVDETGRLRGVITADDVFDVIQEEATEDIYQSSGIDTTGPEPTEEVTHNVPVAFRARLPWLVITVLIETIALNHRLKEMGFNSAKDFNVKLLETISKKQGQSRAFRENIP